MSEVGEKLSPEQKYWTGWVKIGVVTWCVSVLPLLIMLGLILWSVWD